VAQAVSGSQPKSGIDALPKHNLPSGFISGSGEQNQHILTF
jgi:hypothetical protein